MSERPKAAFRPISLALQGGGSHGALTWGVLDALLEDGGLDFDGISGTSAGAMNAVAVAHGFAQAAAQTADPQQARVEGAALARAALTRLWEGIGALGGPGWGDPLMLPAMAWMTPWL
ncbi:MAG: patatin-like phospholipase family protein, partial [Giesbergeria sp.]